MNDEYKLQLRLHRHGVFCMEGIMRCWLKSLASHTPLTTNAFHASSQAHTLHKNAFSHLQSK